MLSEPDRFLFVVSYVEAQNMMDETQETRIVRNLFRKWHPAFVLCIQPLKSAALSGIKNPFFL